MRQLIGALLFSLSFSFVISQTPSIEWKKSFGGSDQDIFWNVIQLTNETWLADGFTVSTDFDVATLDGMFSWLVNFDDDGNILWQRTYNALNPDENPINGPRLIVANKDGFLIMSGGAEMLITQMDLDGNILWENFNTFEYDWLQTNQFLALNDGSYLLVGWSSEFPGYEYIDSWIMKLDAQGDMVWARQYGGTEDDAATDAIQTADGGYLVIGYTFSDDGDVSNHYGETDEADYWLLKIDSIGLLEWERNYGGTNGDEAVAIDVYNNGHYIISGNSISADVDVIADTTTFARCWTIVINEMGDIVRQSIIGDNFETCTVMDVIPGRGFLLAGTDPNRNSDYWAAEINMDLDEVWSWTLGGSEYEELTSGVPARDGGILLSGFSSSRDGDVTDHHGTIAREDAWVVKLAITEPCRGTLQETLCFGDSLILEGVVFDADNPSGEIRIDGGVDCDSIVFVSLSFLDEITLVDSAIENDNGTGNGSIEPIISGGTGDYMYLWSNGETTLNIENLTTGFYTLFIEDSNGCTAEFMFEVELNTSLDETELIEVLVYPNPFDEYITLDNLPSSVRNIDVYNNVGQRVYSALLDGHRQVMVASSALEPGVYYINLMTEDNRSLMYKVVKR